jgi:predicted lipoprotein with Yx(FWY)xxD motif
MRRWVLPALVAAGLLGVTATASAAPGPVASPDTVGQVAPAAGTAMVKVVTHATVGTILTDGSSRTLYLFTRDERNKSNCTGGCLAVWPPLLTDGAPEAGPGVTASALGTVRREDGSMQVTYNGWPLYYYVQDQALSDVKGQNVNNVWFVVSPYGGPRVTGASVKVTNGVLTDMSGRTLYLFTRDAPGVSNCTGTCALIWPPALSVGNGKAEEGANGLLLDLTRREEGSTQLTYNGWPLYYYAGDEKPGDMKGQGVNGVWWVVSPAGTGLQTLPTAAPAAPAALPRTGDVAGGLMAAISVVGTALAAAGVWLRRRAAAD